MAFLRLGWVIDAVAYAASFNIDTGIVQGRLKMKVGILVVAGK